jgi:hypothetical protein
MPQGDHAYWKLVEELMLAGWYREGQDRTHDPSGRSWHFRHGHALDHDAGRDRWVLALSEEEAMRILLEQLGKDEAAR